MRLGRHIAAPTRWIPSTVKLTGVKAGSAGRDRLIPLVVDGAAYDDIVSQQSNLGSHLQSVSTPEVSSLAEVTVL